MDIDCISLPAAAAAVARPWIHGAPPPSVLSPGTKCRTPAPPQPLSAPHRPSNVPLYRSPGSRGGPAGGHGRQLDPPPSVPILKVHAATRTIPTPTASASDDDDLDAHGCGHCCTVARTRAGGGANPRHRTCGRHSPPPLRPPQAAAHPLPLPPPPTRPYVIPASLPSSTCNVLRLRWISPDSGAAEWKASHVPVATGKWLAHVGVAPPFFVRQRRSLATKAGFGWGLSCDDETLSSETFITNSPSASSGPCTSTRLLHQAGDYHDLARAMRIIAGSSHLTYFHVVWDENKSTTH
ncbi:uncharacterized protein [Miscanthus floridulus]|uniref:uncharacterized protein isoform X2 n=1 Tax=Miscanthus floridulus TaxID=154761 RepID=UPI003458B4D9